MLPSRYSYQIEGNKVVFLDKEHDGELTIKIKPTSTKVGSVMMFGIANDIVTALSTGKLVLTLKGKSVIRVRHDLILEGNVVLKSCHLTDTVIVNSELRFVSMEPYTEFRDSIISHVGKTRFGKYVFQECQFNANNNVEFPPTHTAMFHHNSLIH